MSEIEPVFFEGHFRPFRPMLAAKRKRGMPDAQFLGKLRFPLWETPKLDGIRCLTVDRPGITAESRCCAVTRHLKTLPNRMISQHIGERLFAGLDGELLATKDGFPPRDFNQEWIAKNMLDYYHTSSALLSIDTMPSFVYVIFDYCPDRQHREMGYTDRLASLEEGLQVTATDRCHLLRPRLCEDVHQLRAMLKQREQQGFEGCVLRTSGGQYKFGRATLRECTMVAVKTFEDSDAVVIDVLPLMRNTARSETNSLGYSVKRRTVDDLKQEDTLGSLRVRDVETGIEFNVGSGFAELQRRDLWTRRKQLKGKMIKYRHQKYGAKEGGAARIPVFLGFREN